jgi:hypothetical protein
MVDILSELSNKRRINRRKFLAGVGAAGAATAIAGCSGPAAYTPPASTSTSTSYGDVDYLTFALNLEYLEAEFYLRAATGSGLIAADAGTGAGTVVGGAQITGLTTAQQNILNEIAYDERAHVRFLRSAIGSTVVSRPNLDLTNSFNALASAAGIGSTFNPFADFNHFLVGAFIFEDVGVTAYSGAAPLISVAGIAAGYLTAAAGILAVEAYHAAYVRTTLTAQAIALGSTAYPYLGYANQVSMLRGSLGGGNETPLVIPTGTVPFTATSIPTPSSIVAATSANAIAYARTTDQVLHIVYGTASNTAGSTTVSAGVAKGGFFPNGLNGNITVTQS